MREEVRPRFGKLTRVNGSEVPLVFHRYADDPMKFVALSAADEKPVGLGAGDRLTVDVLGPGSPSSYRAGSSSEPASMDRPAAALPRRPHRPGRRAARHLVEFHVRARHGDQVPRRSARLPAVVSRRGVVSTRA